MRGPGVTIIGPPNAGKGTQVGRILQEYSDAFHPLASGDMIRRIQADSTPLGMRVRGMLTRGELVDDTTMTAIFLESLAAAQRDGCLANGKQPFTDGYPRTVAQAVAIDPHIDFQLVLHLTGIPYETLLARMEGRVAAALERGEQPRLDDTPDALRRRWRQYRKETLPVAYQYLGFQGWPRGVVCVDGNRQPEAVWADIKRTLDAYLDR